MFTNVTLQFIPKLIKHSSSFIILTFPPLWLLTVVHLTFCPIKHKKDANETSKKMKGLIFNVKY